MKKPFALTHYDAAIFDLDGTVWLSGEPLPGAAEFFDHCRVLGLAIAFATNISVSSIDDVRRSLLAADAVTAKSLAPIRIDRGIVYGQLDGFRPLELDLYRPGNPSSQPRPLVACIHGGGWRVSSRHQGPRETRSWSRSIFERWTDAGFAVAAVEYRYSGEAVHPGPIDDVKTALSWLRDNSAAYDIDPDKLVLWGQSAGGYLAASVGLATDIAAVSAVICWYPITDLPSMVGHDDSAFVELYLGHPISDDIERAMAASPSRADISVLHRFYSNMAPTTPLPRSLSPCSSRKCSEKPAPT